MFNLAIEWGLIGSNPVKGVKFFRVNNEPMRILTEEEFLRIYDNSADHLKPILLCAISTGMRKGEILNLKWDDVNLHSDSITVRDSKNYDFRVIPINETLKSVLNELHETSSNDFVFNYQARPVKETTRSFETALKKSGIPKCRFHDLRHTFATRLVMNGVDLVTVQELLGHKSIIMTKRRAARRDPIARGVPVNRSATMAVAVKSPKVRMLTEGKAPASGNARIHTPSSVPGTSSSMVI